MNLTKPMINAVRVRLLGLRSGNLQRNDQVRQSMFLWNVRSVTPVCVEADMSLCAQFLGRYKHYILQGSAVVHGRF